MDNALRRLKRTGAARSVDGIRWERYRHSKARDHPRLFAEGDSWHDLPIDQNGYNDVVDYLGQTFGYAVFPRADSGAELTSIRDDIVGDPTWPSTILGEDPDAMLLDGGGNDLFHGRLADLLDTRADGRRGADLLRNDEVESLMEELRALYREIVDYVDSVVDDLPIFVHGYAVPFASGQATEILGVPVAGPWIRHILLDRGIDDETEQREILTAVVRRFNELLAQLDESTPQVHYVDVRPLATEPGDWRDELHLVPKGCRRVAAALDARIRAECPHLFPQEPPAPPVPWRRGARRRYR